MIFNIVCLWNLIEISSVCDSYWSRDYHDDTGSRVVRSTTRIVSKREHLKNLRGRITDNHRLSPEGYAGKEKGKWLKEDMAMEQEGSENP